MRQNNLKDFGHLVDSKGRKQSVKKYVHPYKLGCSDWRTKHENIKSYFWLKFVEVPLLATFAVFFYNYFSHFFPKMRLMLIPTYDIEYILLTAIAPVIEYCLSGKTTPLDRVTVVLTSCLWEDMKMVGVSWYPVQFFQSPRSKIENVNYSSTHLFAGCCSCKMPKFSFEIMI